MTRREAGSAAQAGYWFNLSSWEVHPVPADGEQLPGQPGQQWIAIPVLAAVALAPILGLTFLMFLPFIGIYLTIEAALRPLLRVFQHQAEALAVTMGPGWQPGEAHLTGKRSEEGRPAEGQEPPAARPEDELERLAREIESRRQPRA